MDLANRETERRLGRRCESGYGGGTVGGRTLGCVRSEGGSEKEMGSQGEGCGISKDSASVLKLENVAGRRI